MAAQAKFSKNTKLILAKRAGFRCSFPGCDRATSGPGKDADSVEETGMAAHIYSASDGGPRGTGGLSEVQRSKAVNGIWCCYKHGKLIDSDSGRRYSVHDLQRWKGSHEARIDREHRHHPRIEGGIARLTILRSPLFLRNSVIEFGKVTLLLGNNGTGKTALCEWILAACGRRSGLSRWFRQRPDRDSIMCELESECPQPEKCLLYIQGFRFRIRLGRTAALSIANKIAVVCPETRHLDWNDTDDIAVLSNALGVDRYSIIEAVHHAHSLSLPYVSSLHIDEQDQEGEDSETEEPSSLPNQPRGSHRSILAVFASIENSRSRRLKVFSSGEQMMVTFSVAIALADIQSAQCPTVLILDIAAGPLVDNILNMYAEILAAPRFRFQSVLVSCSERPKVDWAGWSVVRLRKKPPNVAIEQNPVF